MKHILALLPAFAWLAAATCCRSNQCLREIAVESVPGRDGRDDCSSYLAVTVTPDVHTVYETISDATFDYTTQVESEAVTVTETTTTTTETVLFTDKTTSTAKTEINVSTAIATVVAATQTQISTTTVTKTSPVLKIRQDDAPFPEYAA